MKKIYFLLLIVAASCLASCSVRNGVYIVEVCATNDLHGRYFDSLYVENNTHPYSLANVSEYIKQLREANGKEGVLLVDVGDAVQGDNAAFYSNFIDTADHTKKHLFTRVTEYIGYDALVVGNHDIEAGHSVYDRIYNETTIPYLAANAIDVKTGKPYFKPYAIYNKNGLKIAVIGMTNPNIKKWLGEELWYGMDFIEIEDQAQQIINSLQKKEKPDVIILAVHAGIGGGKETDVENPARYLAYKLNGVDIVLAAHDHQIACEKVASMHAGRDSVLVLDGSNRAKFLSNATVELEYKDGKLVSKDISGRLVPMENVPVDTAYTKAFREDFLVTKAFTNQEIGTLEKEIKTSDAFFGMSEYMNFIHKIQLTASGASVSLAAPLTFNGTVNAGTLKYNDLFTLYPFENQLYVVNLTGEQIKKHLEYSYDMWINTMNSPADHILKIRYDNRRGRYSFTSASYNFDSGAGLNYTVDVTKPYGERISILSFANGSVFEMEKTYKVAMSSYRANGGGDILTKGVGLSKDSLESIIVEKQKDIRSLIYDYYTNNAGSGDKAVGAENTIGEWKFIPEKMVTKALERDSKLLLN